MSGLVGLTRLVKQLRQLIDKRILLRRVVREAFSQTLPSNAETHGKSLRRFMMFAPNTRGVVRDAT